MDAGTGLWLYRDAKGLEHLVQRYEQVPAGARARQAARMAQEHQDLQVEQSEETE